MEKCHEVEKPDLGLCDYSAIFMAFQLFLVAFVFSREIDFDFIKGWK